MTTNLKRNRGFIKVILLIVVLLVVLGFLGFDVRDIMSSPKVRENLSYFWEIFLKGWDALVVTPTLWLWNKLAALRS